MVGGAPESVGLVQRSALHEVVGVQGYGSIKMISVLVN
jgi:hypothetical protein